ncbi:hypothetical protein, partial [Citrobacter portucalensis]|uniref:hypothetical protein n=1 Tax=Citrobacter portucalensis TaxID=1639133 RepID=UPI00226B1468
MMTPPVSPTPEIKTVHRSARNGEQPQPVTEAFAQVQTEERETAAEFPKAAPRILPAGVQPQPVAEGPAHVQTEERDTAAAQRTLAVDVQPLSDAEPPAPERTVRMMTPPAFPAPEIKTVHRSAR